MVENRLDRALAHPRTTRIDAAQARLRGKRDKGRAKLGHAAAADGVLLLGQHDDRAPLRRLVGKGSKLGSIGKLLLGHAAHWTESGRLPVAEGDRAGL